MKRRTAIAAGLSLALAVLAGCAGDDDTVAEEPGATSSPPAAAEVLPSQLVGTWEVEGAGVEPGTMLMFTASEVRVFVECGLLDGSWKALVGGAFLADAYSASGGCRPTNNNFTPAWLEGATEFALDGDDRELRDSAGALLASLEPASRRPNVPSNVIESHGDPPVLTDAERAKLDRMPPAFPAGIRPAERSELLGTWVRPGESADGDNWPFVTFQADGRWTGSDGCNGLGSRWAFADGALLLVDFAQTLIGCENVNLLGDAVLAGFDGSTLVLLDENGTETHRAVSGPAPKRPTSRG
ncbi:META domain-containing protein [Sporichthya polymorpha]|uniref:META domain-containing protein n=1 Tax=Sporichthya polymorpha TaxID=35751 RepID=UPI0003629B0A|nr:META domain-containing protein [Sporichthya polymorpha]